mgnify:CR=1 FL=1
MSSRPCRDQGTASSRSTGPDASASAETEETVVPFARAASAAWVSGGARMVAESGSVRRTARRDDREPTLALRAGDAAAADGRLKGVLPHCLTGRGGALPTRTRASDFGKYGKDHVERRKVAAGAANP